MFANTINARNVNDALATGLRLLVDVGGTVEVEQSRNGPVRSWPGPVLTVTMCPRERVLFSPVRNANPFFHLFESLWMLAGRNDLAWLTQFNKRMAAYSDDGGVTQPGAYGHRWRRHFGFDQIEVIVEELKRNPQTRRAVLTMWDADNEVESDLHAAINGSADVPCNTQCYFRIRGGKLLDMAVTCRSNDILWGAHGANAVHFSVLQEYVAARVGVGLGVMYQFSFNYHLYPDVMPCPPIVMARDVAATDYYQQGTVDTTPIFGHGEDEHWERDLRVFMAYAEPNEGLTTGRPSLIHPFLRKVAVPMLRAWRAHKQHDYEAASGFAWDIAPGDWARACQEWIQRRRLAVRQKMEIGA